MRQALQAGKLWHEVSIEQRGDSRDDYGESDPYWSEYLAVYAQIENLSGNELLQSQQVNSRVTSKITIRYDESYSSSAGIRAAMRVVFKSRNYGILWINKLSQYSVMELYCERLEDVTNG